MTIVYKHFHRSSISSRKKILPWSLSRSNCDPQEGVRRLHGADNRPQAEHDHGQRQGGDQTQNLVHINQQNKSLWVHPQHLCLHDQHWKFLNFPPTGACARCWQGERVWLACWLACWQVFPTFLFSFLCLLTSISIILVFIFPSLPFHNSVCRQSCWHVLYLTLLVVTYHYVCPSYRHSIFYGMAKNAGIVEWFTIAGKFRKKVFFVCYQVFVESNPEC